MIVYDLKVGYSCNNKCKHCVIDDSKDKLISSHKSIDLTTEECLSQIDLALEKGIDSIVLTGGEVTIRKDFSILLQKCVSSNLAITVQTNARKLGDYKLLESIKNIKDIRFVVALHGSIPFTHDNITLVQGSFVETCDSIKKVCALGKLVIIKVVISKMNMRELPDIVKLAKELGVEYICFAFPHGQGAARKNFEEVIPKYSELKHWLHRTIELAKIYNINIEFEAIPFCIIPQAMHLVGELKFMSGKTLCTQVREETFEWDEVRKDIKKKGAECHRCDMKDLCEGPWMEYIDAFGDNELIPITLSDKYKAMLRALVK